MTLLRRQNFYYLFFALFSALFFVIRPIQLSDLSVWTALGRDILKAHHLLTVDTYTFVQTKPMVYPPLSPLLYGVLEAFGGVNLVTMFHALIPSLWIASWVYVLRSKKGHELTNFAVCVLAISLLGTTLIFTPRPAMVATLILLFTYIFLIKRENVAFKFREYLALFIAGVLWVNVHGSFPFLIVMILAQALLLVFSNRASIAKSRFFAAILCTLSFLVNPVGWGFVDYLRETAQISTDRNLMEWFPPHRFFYPFTATLFFILIIAFLAFVWKKQNWKLLLDPFAAFCVAGFFSTRNTFIPFLLLPIFLFYKGEFDFFKPTKENSALSKTINAFILIITGASLYLFNPFNKFAYKDLLPLACQETYDRATSVSRKITDYLNENPGLIFNEWIYGSDLALEQTNKYFVDIRNIIFPDSVILEHDYFIRAPEAGLVALEKYHIKYFLISSQKPSTVDWLKNSPSFKQVADDGVVFLFEKKN